MRTDYIQTFNDELGMTIESAKRVLELKRAEVERLERFIHVCGQMAAPEGVDLIAPSGDAPAFLRPREIARGERLAEAVATGVAVAEDSGGRLVPRSDP